jgi:hypothetical protein
MIYRNMERIFIMQLIYPKTRKYIYCGYIFSTRTVIYREYNMLLKGSKFLDLLITDIKNNPFPVTRIQEYNIRISHNK